LPVYAVADSNEIVDIALVTNNGTVTLPGNLVKKLAKGKTSNVNVVISKYDKVKLSDAAKKAIKNRPVVEVKLYQDGKKVEAKTKITIDYTPTATEKSDFKHIVVYKIGKNGVLKIVSNGRYDVKAGKVIVNGDVNAVYAIGYVKAISTY
jgi:endo-1,4-beta-xylanase